MTRAGIGLPHPTGPLRQGVWAVRDWFVNFFVFATRKGPVCIDAGWRAGGSARGMRRNGFDAGEVRAVLLTHGHWDHGGGLSCFTRAELFAGAEEESRLERETTRSPYPGRSRTCHWVEEGDLLEFEDVALRVLRAPGHTAGSLAFLANDGSLYAGDAAWRCGGLRTFPDAMNQDAAAARASLERLRGSPGVKRIVTAHSGTWATCGSSERSP